MSWGTAGLIILGWIGGTIVVYIILYLLDKLFKFQDHKGWSDLGRAIIYLFITFVPPVFIVFLTLFLNIEGTSRIAFLIVAVVVILGFPAYCFGMQIIYSPKRMAKYCMSQAGDYEKHHKYYQEEYRERLKRDISEHEILAEYIVEQLNLIYKKMYLSFKYMNIDRKSDYINAIIENNQVKFPEISAWEVVDNVHPGIWFIKSLFLSFEDDDQQLICLYYKLGPDQKLASYVKNSEHETQLLVWKKFKNISMTGRLCYSFMCIEKYLVTLYPEADWRSVALNMWPVTGKSSYGWPVWNQNMIYHAINILMSYEDIYHKDDELSVKKKRADEIMRLLMQVAKTGDYIIHNDQHTTYFNLYEDESVKMIYKISNILKEKNIPLPDMEKMSDFKFDRKTVKQHGENKEAWGYDIDTKYLSIILNEKK